ncbi:MAG: MaoC family dehydratase [Lachnospiraceae bacterium]|nr:MaoC family dehydratase [Lachnospiraceae bacterium]
MNTYTFDEINIGHKEDFTVTVTEADRDRFREITGDINPLHNDPKFAKSKGHDKCVAFGMLSASYLSTLAGVYLPGKNSLIQKTEVNFRKPVYVGDTLTISGEVTDKSETFNVIEVKVLITNQDGVKVVKGKMEIAVVE